MSSKTFLDFVCPKCGDTHLRHVLRNVTLVTDIDRIRDVDGLLHFHCGVEEEQDCSEIKEEYVCAGCSCSIATSREGLRKLLTSKGRIDGPESTA